MRPKVTVHSREETIQGRKLYEEIRYIKVLYLDFGIFMLLQMSVSKILTHGQIVLQNYQNFIELTSKIIYIVAHGVGVKSPPGPLYALFRVTN